MPVEFPAVTVKETKWNKYLHTFPDILCGSGTVSHLRMTGWSLYLRHLLRPKPWEFHEEGGAHDMNQDRERHNESSIVENKCWLAYRKDIFLGKRFMSWDIFGLLWLRLKVEWRPPVFFFFFFFPTMSVCFGQKELNQGSESILTS